MREAEARILITAPKSGSGKTTVTCALLGALTAAGHRISACKCGPDYIDPMFHRAVLGVPSGNLDSFFTDDAMTCALLRRRAVEAEVTVIEGAMGYYDGLGGTSERGSAYEIARITRTPVILVVDAKGASVSLAASIRGMLDYRGDAGKAADEGDQPGSADHHSGIRGILLNRVSAGYFPRLKKLIEEECGVPVLGYFPVLQDLSVPSRHLGLVSPEGIEDAREWARRIAEQAAKTIDLDVVLRIARSAPRVPGRGDVFAKRIPKLSVPVRIAVARDEAFSFYYEENFAVLRQMGAEIVEFSPLRDEHLPEDIDGIIFGGGYPELHGRELQKNPIRAEVRRAIRGGLPCIAECGGFLYLQKTLEDESGKSRKMAHVLSGRGFPTGKLCRFGYCEAETLRGGLYGDAGTHLRGHEFHHWDTDANGDGMRLTKPLRGQEEAGVVYTDTLAAGFPHFYYPGCIDAARGFLETCLRRRVRKMAKARWDGIAHPLDGLGKLEELTARLCGIAGTPAPYDLTKRALVVFCGDHGVVKEGVTQSDYKVTRNVADALAAGRSTVNRMAQSADAEVFVVDVGIRGAKYPEREVKPGVVIDRRVGRGTGNLAESPAMSERQCARAIAAGEEICASLAAQGYTLLAAGEMGIGNTTAAAALTAALLHLDAEQVVGRGAGLDDAGLVRKTEAVARALERVRTTAGGDAGDDSGSDVDTPRGDLSAAEEGRSRGSAAGEALRLLAEVGGYEIAAMAGLFIGGARHHIPVVADGVISLAAALAAERIDPRVREILFVSHKPVEPAGKYLLKALGEKPILHGGFHLGEGSGAVLLFPLLDMAEAVYRETPSFADRGIEAYQRFAP